MAETKQWVYDRVEDGYHQIVALCYHTFEGENGSAHPNCLDKDREQLHNEGLYISLSLAYPSLMEARAAAWKEKDKFSGGLD